MGCHRIEVWGDESPTRELIHVEDAAEEILLAGERYESSDPVNIGLGVEISIRDLPGVIVRHTGVQANIRWDPTRSIGQPRRLLE